MVCVKFSLSQDFVFLVGDDGAVGGGISNASQDESLSKLIIVKESLLRVIDRACGHFACASAASTSLARVWELDTEILGSIENEDVIGALDLLLAIRRHERHVVAGHHLHISPSDSRSGAHLAVEVVAVANNVGFGASDGKAGVHDARATIASEHDGSCSAGGGCSWCVTCHCTSCWSGQETGSWLLHH